jgi:hypothetical protein
MLRRFALASGLIVLSALACAPKASAQSVNVDSSATVPNTCLFGSPSSGTLKLTYPGGYPYLSSYGADGGTPPTVSISCNGPMNLSISPATVISAPSAYTSSYSPQYCYAYVFPQTGSFASSGYSNSSCSSSVTTSGNFITNSTGTTGTLQVPVQVYMAASGTLLPPGNYTLRTTLTAVP